jgi:hypothetical protein
LIFANSVSSSTSPPAGGAGGCPVEPLVSKAGTASTAGTAGREGMTGAAGGVSPAGSSSIGGRVSSSPHEGRANRRTSSRHRNIFFGSILNPPLVCPKKNHNVKAYKAKKEKITIMWIILMYNYKTISLCFQLE